MNVHRTVPQNGVDYNVTTFETNILLKYSRISFTASSFLQFLFSLYLSSQIPSKLSLNKNFNKVFTINYVMQNYTNFTLASD